MKQDRQGVRKASDIEQKYKLTNDYSEIAKIASDAKRTAEAAITKAGNATAEANKASQDVTALEERVSILEQTGGGGFCPQIVVTAPTGSTVTCSKGDTVLSAEEVNGTWTFNVTDYGEWTITRNDQTLVVLVDTVKQYRESLGD